MLIAVDIGRETKIKSAVQYSIHDYMCHLMLPLKCVKVSAFDKLIDGDECQERALFHPPHRITKHPLCTLSTS